MLSKVRTGATMEPTIFSVLCLYAKIYYFIAFYLIDSKIITSLVNPSLSTEYKKSMAGSLSEFKSIQQAFYWKIVTMNHSYFTTPEHK